MARSQSDSHTLVLLTDMEEGSLCLIGPGKNSDSWKQTDICRPTSALMRNMISGRSDGSATGCGTTLRTRRTTSYSGSFRSTANSLALMLYALCFQDPASSQVRRRAG